MTRDYNIKCAVKDCENHSNEGQFVGLLCLPCHRFIAGDGGLYSQAFRNSSDMIKQAVEAERGACAKVCLNMEGMAGDYADKYAAAIRARGEK
jgi:coenzyme F420-reducing hydrogenase beta subunit